MELLNRPGSNKGTAFTEDERSALGLHGLLPPHVESLEEQVVRAYEAYQRKGPVWLPRRQRKNFVSGSWPRSGLPATQLLSPHRGRTEGTAQVRKWG